MNIVLDNIIFSLQQAGGISVVWEHLLKEFMRRGVHFSCIEYDDALCNIHRSNVMLPDSYIDRRKLYNGLIQQFLKPEVTNREPFIFHSSYFRLSKSIYAKHVTTVHDFIYERQPKMSFAQRIRTKLNHKAILGSDAVVCISENTKRDLFHFVPEVDPSKVHVVYNGVSEDYRRLLENDNSLDGFIVYVGGRQSYKNFDFAVRAVAASRYRLLICGSPLNERETKFLDSCLGRERYRVMIHPTNRELNLIYNSVVALLYPSSYEGFGLPVLEAQKAGCPVIALNASSISEIVGDKTLLMECLSIRQFIDMLSIIDNHSARDEVIGAGIENASKYRWENMAGSYQDIYKQIL